MAARQYIGARYVPLYVGDWESTRSYEPLSIVTDGNGNSYTSLKDVPAGTALTNRNYWVLTSSFSGAIEVLNRRLGAAEDSIEKLKYLIDPDNYSGTDTQKIQSAVDALEDGATIVIRRNYTLSGDIDLSTSTNIHETIFMGLGGKINLGINKFFASRATINRSFSGAQFIGVTFENIRGAGAFDADTLIRCSFIGCVFEDVTGTIVNAVDYVQQFIFDDCHILGPTITNPAGQLINSKDLLSVQITNCRIENINGVIKSSGSSHNLLMTGNTIESIWGDAISLGERVFGANISSNYFEFIKTGAAAINLSLMLSGEINIEANYFKAATNFSNKFTIIPSGTARKIRMNNNSLPISNSILLEVSGTNGIVRYLNLGLNDGQIVDPNNQIPTFPYFGKGCTFGSDTAFNMVTTFGTSGIVAALPMRLGASLLEILTISTESGTQLNPADFTIEYDNDMFMHLRCATAAVRSQVAGQTVIMNVKLKF